MKQIIYTIFLLFYFLGSTTSFAQPNLQLSVNSTQVKTGEEFNLSITVPQTEVIACTLHIYFNPFQTEVVNLPNNSQLYENHLIYTWHDTTGGNNPISQAPILTIPFKAKQAGNISFSVDAQIYTPQEEELFLTSTTTLSAFSPKEAVPSIISSTHKEDASLYTLRISEEGLTPAFQQEITDYYFLASPELENLQVTAIPSNSNASVQITGNTMLPLGESTISILVTSEDLTQTKEYKIHVTKTSQPERANANLETLAVENITLSPSFDPSITHYTASVPTSLETANILAIPSDENATVSMQGNKNLIVGDNTIRILVTAANSSTSKEYILILHKRSTEEEAQYTIELEEQVNQLAQAYEATSSENTIIPEETSTVQKGKQRFWYIFLPAFLILCFLFIILVYYNHSKTKENEGDL